MDRIKVIAEFIIRQCNEIKDNIDSKNYTGIEYDALSIINEAHEIIKEIKEYI